MGLIFIRTTILFIALFIVIRLMGKRQLGEMEPYEFVVTLIIAELACIPMQDIAIPLLYGIIAILTVYFLHQIVCVIELNFRKAKDVLSGKTSIVLNKSGIDDSQLKANNLSVSDLVTSLRNAGFFSLDALEYAVYESEGKISVLPKQNYESLQTSLPIILIEEGKWDERNLSLTQREKGYYLSILHRQGCVELEKVLIMTVDGEGKIYLQITGNAYQVFHLGWEETLW